MTKNLIIGNASGYTWDHLKYWVNSIKKTGYDGDVVIVGTDMSGETVRKLTDQGIILNLFGKQTEDGGVESLGSTIPPHVERFFYISSFLRNNDYNHIVMTDTRDVVFQNNPFDWLVEILGEYDLVVADEGMRYENEPWGNQNLYQAFGPHYYSLLKDHRISNVGVIAGRHTYVSSIVDLIFQLSLGRPIPIVDQAVYNYIMSLRIFDLHTFFVSHEDPWAVNLGTTIEAVKAGNGDLGALCKKDSNNLKKYNMNYESIQPTILEDGTVTNGDKPYSVVHQWDRIPSLKEIIEKKYGDDNAN